MKLSRAAQAQVDLQRYEEMMYRKALRDGMAPAEAKTYAMDQRDAQTRLRQQELEAAREKALREHERLHPKRPEVTSGGSKET